MKNYYMIIANDFSLQDRTLYVKEIVETLLNNSNWAVSEATSNVKNLKKNDKLRCRYRK